MKMFIELRHLILRHMLGVYAGKIVLNLIELRHYFSRRFQVLRVAKNPLKLSKSPKSVSANAENCVSANRKGTFNWFIFCKDMLNEAQRVV